MSIIFKTVDRSNWQQIIDLNIKPEQRGFVASNDYSLAQAAYEPDTYPFAIYKDDVLVGFIMYEFDSDHCIWEMCRLMIDEKYQGQGIGKSAVSKLLDMVAKKHGHVKFYTSAEPANIAAISLYEKLGFKKTGRIVYGEVQLETQL